MLKYLYWVTGIIVGLLVAISITLSVIDWNQYRSTLADMASEKTGMKVELAGPMAASLFPRPAISVELVRLSPLNSQTADSIATADRIDVRVGLIGLLKGNLSIQSLVLEGVDLAVEQSASGTWQVRGWPETTEEETKADIDLARFELKNSRISILPYGEKPVQLEKMSVQLDGSLPAGPLTWQGEFQVGGEKIALTGSIKPVESRQETAVKLDVYAAGAEFTVSGRLSESRSFTGRTQLAGDDLRSTVGAVSRALGSAALSAPALPFAVDLQLDRDGDINRVVSRTLSLGETLGRADLTIVQKKGQSHTTGSISLGVINLDEWNLAGSPGTKKARSSTAIPAKAATANSGLSGSIDLTVEGIRLRGGLGQRIDSVVVFDEQGVGLTRLQALLPGATTLSFNGKLTSAGLGGGKLQVDIGNIPELAKWLEIDAVSSVPDGRLTTASMKADVVMSDHQWQLNSIAGSVDTTKLSGHIMGSMVTMQPEKVRINADTVNMDAYLPNFRFDTSSEPFLLPENTNLDFDVHINQLQWLNTSFSDAAMKGALKAGKLHVAGIDVKHGKGSLAMLDSSVQTSAKEATITASFRLKNWDLPEVRYFAPEYWPQIRAAGFDTLNGTISAAGPMSALRIGLDIGNGKDSLLASGSVNVQAEGLTKADLQTSFTHHNLAPLLRTAGLVDLKKMPAEVAVSFALKGGNEPYEIKGGGTLAGAKVQMAGTVQGENRKVTGSFDHPRSGDLFTLTGIQNPGLDVTQPVRGEINYDSGAATGRQTLKITGLKNGTATVDGNLYLQSGQKFGGKLSASGLDLDQIWAVSAAENSSKKAQQEKPATTPMAGYAGTIDLSLENIRMGGQTLSAPAMSVVAGDGILRLSAGNNARLNDAPLLLQLDLDMKSGQTFNGKIKADNIDIAAALASGKLGKIATAKGVLDISVSGDLKAGLAGLRATGNLTSSGGTLNFLSVPALVSEMTAATSGKGFLGKVGGLLRGGTTPITAMEASFTLDSGIMLVEAVKANGPWGNFALDGQVNLLDRYLDMKGALSLVNPPDTPAIPVKYAGKFDGPTADWSSRLFERYVLAGIEQRIRGVIFKELEAKPAAEGQPDSPGAAGLGTAFSLLEKLRQKQKEAEEAKAKAAAQAAEGQKP